MHYLFIQPDQKKWKIEKEVYGNFSEHLGRCIYEGVYVGENSEIPNVNGMRTDVVEALKEMKLPVLRWPGGCFADEYHWKDGIGPKETRKKMINTHWGGVVEDNSFGTHEFFELCRQIGCEPYVNGNVGSGTVQEMNEWVEYMTFDGLSPRPRLPASGRPPRRLRRRGSLRQADRSGHPRQQKDLSLPPRTPNSLPRTAKSTPRPLLQHTRKQRCKSGRRARHLPEHRPPRQD